MKHRIRESTARRQPSIDDSSPAIADRILKRVSLVAIVVLLASAVPVACGQQLPDAERRRTSIYNTDPEHLWNRLHRVMFVRRGPDEKMYGHDRLEPLLWTGTKHLLEKDSRDRAVAVLDEFIAQRGERLVEDPIRRAILQRDLWLVFNRLKEDHHSHLMAEPKLSSDAIKASQKQLGDRLASVIKQLALSPVEIRKLPDNYAAAVASNKFAKHFDAEKPDQPFLPADLFVKDGPWVCVGPAEGPVAPAHLNDEGGNVFTNSAFLAFLRLPNGRIATAKFLKRLSLFDQPLFVQADQKQNRRALALFPNPNLPQLPVGTQVALVRQALLIDSSLEVAATRLTESVQVRVYREIPPMTRDSLNGALTSGTKANRRAQSWQSFFEFRLSRNRLFSGRTGGLVAIGSEERDFKTGFGAHPWDEFERKLTTERPFTEASQRLVLRQSCFACHSLPGIYSLNSHFNFRTSNWRNEKVATIRPSRLEQISVADVLSKAVAWKSERDNWASLRTLMEGK